MLGRAMQQDVHVCADVHVTQLESTGEGKDERYVFTLGEFLANNLDLRLGSGRQTTGQRRIAVDVEFEKVEERIRHERDGAIDLSLSTVVELQRSTCLVAYGERNPFELMLFVFDMFARFPVHPKSVSTFSHKKLVHLSYELRRMHSTGIRAP